MLEIVDREDLRCTLISEAAAANPCLHVVLCIIPHVDINITWIDINTVQLHVLCTLHGVILNKISINLHDSGLVNIN